MEKLRILLDLDEVLADFVGAALRLHKWTMPEYIKAQEEQGRLGQWNMVPTMGLAFNEWLEPIAKGGPGFWRSLYPTKWLNQLLEMVQSYTNDWFIVSSPIPDILEQCHLGKLRWVCAECGPLFANRTIITSDKSLLANYKTLLIDDHEKNCKEFLAAGGNAILFTAITNPCYAQADNPLPFVEERLKLFSEMFSKYLTKDRRFYPPTVQPAN